MKTIEERAAVVKNTFENKALDFLKQLESKTGDDLIYSLALEAGNVFVCVAAHPSMTKKRWDTGNERILFHIDESEYIMDQDELIDDLANRLKSHMHYVDEKDEA